MDLSYKKYGEGQPFIILHGLFGSADNWHTQANKLGNYFEVYVIDQRNHGDSGWSDEFSYDLMAEDLHEFVEKHKLEDFILLGHSMGGKTAMRFAQLYPELIDKLISVDMGIKGYPASHGQIIDGLKSIDTDHVTSRREADEQLAKYVSNKAVRQFLLKNLHREGKESFSWKINLPVLDKKYTEIIGALPNDEVLIDTFFINGGQSGYIIKEDIESIKKVFPLATFYTIESAGHWIHAEAPEEFLEKVLSFSLL